LRQGGEKANGKAPADSSSDKQKANHLDSAAKQAAKQAAADNTYSKPDSKLGSGSSLGQSGSSGSGTGMGGQDELGLSFMSKLFLAGAIVAGCVGFLRTRKSWSGRGGYARVRS